MRHRAINKSPRNYKILLTMQLLLKYIDVFAHTLKI